MPELAIESKSKQNNKLLQKQNKPSQAVVSKGKDISKKTDKTIRLKPDSTIFGMRNDTIKDADVLLNEVKEKDNQHYKIACELYNDVCSFFAGDLDKNIKKINKDNVVRIIKYYKAEAHQNTLTEDICDELIKNKSKIEYITYVKNAFKQRAKELNIKVDDLDRKFDEAISQAFKGWRAEKLGYISNSNIQKIDNVFETYIQRITKKETELRTKLFNKPFPDEEVEKFLDKQQKRGPWVIGHESVHDIYEEELAKDSTLGKGIAFTGKVEFPSKQTGGSCVMHASVNALMQNKKGSHLVNRLFRIIDSKYGGTEIVCLPEAVRKGSFYYPMSNGEDIEQLALQSSFGDGDMAALINAYADYVHFSKSEFALMHLGFEALSGEKAQVFLPDEPIPKGVGLTNAKLVNIRGGYINYEKTLYKNMKEMLDKGNGAIIYSMCTNFLGNNLGKYIKDLKTEEQTDENVFVSSAHAYSVVKLTDEYAYLQESNHPNLYIKLDKETFMGRMSKIATWKF